MEQIEIESKDAEVCPVCSSESQSKLFFESNEWIVRQCSICGFAWTVDIANAPESTAFVWGAEVVKESLKRMAMYRDRLVRIEKYKPSSRTWLDVGCGGGGMLKCVADAGYEAEGIELSPSAEDISSQFNIPIHRRPLSESIADLNHRQYGVVSYFHVLEHVNDPMQELEVTRQLLSDDSLLVIEVPFFGSLPWRLMGTHHRHFYRGHRSYFNDTSLPLLLSKVGLTVLICESVPYKMTLDWLLMRLGSGTNLIRNSLPETWKDIRIGVNTGEYLFAIARVDPYK